jgi:CheY-like chemotaxis protein
MLLEGKNILIVEDNPLNRVVYQITLGLQGAVLEFDRSGREAIYRIKRSEKLDLIILDLMLYGGISGFDILQEIRQFPEYNAIPIIAISASEPAVAIPKARALGFSGYIGKPIDESIFPEQIVRVMAGEAIWYDGQSDNG